MRNAIKIFWLVLLCLVTQNLKANLDSLKTELSQATEREDSLKFLTQICKLYFSSGTVDYDSLHIYSNTLINLSDTSEFKTYFVKGRIYQCASLFYEELEVQLDCQKGLIDIYKQDGKYLMVAQSNFNMALKCNQVGNVNESEIYLNDAIDIMLTHSERDTLPAYHRLLNKIYWLKLYVLQSKRDFEQALDLGYSLIDKFKEDENYVFISRVEGQLARTFSALSESFVDSPLGIEYDSLKLHHLIRRYEVQPMAKDTREEFFATHELARHYIEMDSLIESEKLMYKSLDLAAKVNDKGDICSAHLGLSMLHRAKGEFPKSIDHLRKAESMVKSLNSTVLNLRLLNEYVLTYQENGDRAAGLVKAKQMVDLIENTDDMEVVQRARKTLHKFFKSTNDIRAIRYHEDYHKAKDSLNSLLVLNNINHLRNESKISEKDKLIAQLEADKVRQALSRQRLNNALLVVGMLIIGLILVAYQHHRNQILKSEKKSIDLEYRLLRSQMNPHFTFNTLGSIQSYLLDSGQASKGAFYLAKFAKLMRRILNQSEHSLIPLSDEIETLQHYMELQKLRFENKFDYKIEIDEDVDTEQLMVPPMLIQPSVENAIEHGKVHTIENGLINLSLQKKDGLLRIVVQDNGMGSNSKLQQSNFQVEHKSKAISIIKERFDNIRRIYGSQMKYKFEFLDPNGARVEYTLPLLNEN